MVRPLLRLMKGAKFIGLGIALLMSVVMLQAQTGGQGGLTGTISDASGAVIADATVIATNQNTGIKTEAKTTSAGMYVMNPLPIGVYTVEVTKDGFKTFRQENLTIDGLKVTGLNAELQLGSASEQIIVTAAPPQLEVTNSTLGGLMENKVYSELPIQMSGQQRDATAFATLLPGAQGGARSPIIGGTGNYLTELYLDGIPITTANQQGDNRVIFNSVPIEAVEQFQVLTSSIPAGYQGAGLLNFSIKSGTNKYHGSANMFFRNTIFDTWCYTCKAATKKTTSGATVPADKPYENQNEQSYNVGGPIPYTKNKGFFQFTYDRFHGRAGVTPGTLSVPTTKMRQGDFSEIQSAYKYTLFDPTTQAACTANSTTGACRYAYGQYYAGTGKGPNGNPAGTATNVIPTSQISPIAQYMQKFLPDPSNSSLLNNYLGGVATGYDNWAYVAKVDYDLSASQRISLFFNHGSRLNVPMSVGANPTLPLPYSNAVLARVIIHTAAIEHAWTISPSLLNQFKYGFVQMGGPPVRNTTQGVKDWTATSAGITGLPSGQAAEEFPGATFSGSNTPQTWTQGGGSTATYSSTANTFTVLDNLLWTKGAHSLTFGFQYQFLQSNASTYDGSTGPLNMTYNANSTGQFNQNATTYVSGSGYAYGSYLLGAVGSTSLVVQNYGVMGGRYRPFAPYVQDDWKVTRNLTLNLGLRYDYMPPYTEVKDRWSFLNPSLTNTITGTPGMLQFAGNHGAGVSCNCRTPVETYKKNFGPRLGLAYSVNDKTVVRAGFSISYSHGGGVGGRAGASSGTGQTGYSASTSFTDSPNGPAFYLNNSAAFTAAGLANTNFGGPGWTAPAPGGATAASQLLGTGNYVNGTTYVNPTSVSFADPYLSGRAPTFNFYNIGVQRALSNHVTLTVNYAGSQSHFLATGSATGRGYWNNQVNPSYLLSLGSLYDSTGATPLLQAPATSANVTIAQKNSSASAPYAGFVSAAGTSTGKANATIAQMLKAFPQYSGVTDTWGNIGNNSYNSLQLSLAIQNWKGVTLNVNYTYAQNVGDDGTFRTGFAIPSGALSNSKKSYKADAIEKSATLVSIPQTLSIYGRGNLPFGKGGLGGNNRWVNVVAGGWSLSGIYKYSSGTPLAITYSGCSSVGLSQCMPDLNPNFTGKVRVNGKWGSGATGANVGGGQHLDYTAFQAPQTLQDASICATTINGVKNANAKSCVNLIGNAPRTLAYDLRNPSTYNLDMSVRRTLKLTPERFKFILEADCLNVTNKHTFGGIGTTIPLASTEYSTFGQNTSASIGTAFGRPTTASGNRDWQLAGHITF